MGILVNGRGVVAAAVMALVMLMSCKPVHDPWAAGNDYFAKESRRTLAQQKALRERVLNQAGTGAEGESHESLRFLEK